jgi:hypothetical protein
LGPDLPGGIGDLDFDIATIGGIFGGEFAINEVALDLAQGFGFGHFAGG